MDDPKGLNELMAMSQEELADTRLLYKARVAELTERAIDDLDPGPARRSLRLYGAALGLIKELDGRFAETRRRRERAQRDLYDAVREILADDSETNWAALEQRFDAVTAEFEGARSA